MESKNMLEETDDIVTLKGANGEEIDFVVIAGITHKGQLYAILEPVEVLEGMEEDEALVFKVAQDEDGEEQYDLVLDEEIIDAVFSEYNRLLDEAESEVED